MAELGPLLRASEGARQGTCQSVFSSECFTGEEYISEFIQMVGRIKFFVAYRSWGVLASHWLLDGGHPKVLEVPCSSLPRDPFHRQFTAQLTSSRPAGEPE